MEKILHRLTEIQSDLNQHDLAVYYSHQAGLEMLRNKYPRAKDLFQKALKTCPSDYDFLLTANLYASLGSCFRFLKNEKSAHCLRWFSLAQNGTRFMQIFLISSD